jgi:hypothetical protein
MAAAKGKKKVFFKMLIEPPATEESLVQTGTENQFWHGQQKNRPCRRKREILRRPFILYKKSLRLASSE